MPLFHDRWRERAMREVRDELDRFLNFPLNQNLSLGDFGSYDGKRCRFEWEGNLGSEGIQIVSAGFQNEIAETYSTSNAVTIRSNAKAGFPEVSVRFSRKTALAFQAFSIGFDSAQLKNLANLLGNKIAGGMNWDNSKIILTRLWQADGFTHLVSGGSESSIDIQATVPGTPLGFNFADPNLKLAVAQQVAMSYQAVAQKAVKPYFSVHKLRRRDGMWELYRYGARQ